VSEPNVAPPPKAVNPYARPPEATLLPPTGYRGTLRYLGPSFILIGSIVGSGELILTTSFGAAIGFAGLWFIILSCVSKTVIQQELGRYTISSGDTALEALNRAPGPRRRVSWLVWLWVFWQIPGLLTGGAILGSIGQILSVAWPIMRQEHWALLVAGINVMILLWGRYSLLEKASLVMVISFSAITLFGSIALQYTQYSVPMATVLEGLVVDVRPLLAPLMLPVAVSAFAATGVSAGELLGYTYWCVEKGYARYAGESDQSEEWAARARGWTRVMQVDVWLGTLVFTLTTIAFFWLGAGVLFPQGMRPDDSQMVTTLRHIYTESLGPWASGLFMVGGFFVLYSTVFSGTAGGARMWADLLGVMNVVKFTDFAARVRWIRIFPVLVPAVQVSTFLMHQKPHTVITLGSALIGLQIPIIAFFTVWLRYRRTDRRIAPQPWMDVLLWTSAIVISSVSIAYVWLQGPKVLAAFGLG
jgi:manganese transport protein